MGAERNVYVSKLRGTRAPSTQRAVDPPPRRFHLLDITYSDVIISAGLRCTEGYT